MLAYNPSHPVTVPGSLAVTWTDAAVRRVLHRAAAAGLIPDGCDHATVHDGYCYECGTELAWDLADRYPYLLAA